MAFRKIASSDPRYLVATDILIGDMSDINYEFLLFDRPLILLANEWLKKTFPNIGIKADLSSLEKAIQRSLKRPEEYSEKRKYWLNKTMHMPDGNSSKRVIARIIELANMETPRFLLLHGNDDVLKTHLDPLVKALKEEKYQADYRSHFSGELLRYKGELVTISAHNDLLKGVPCGFRVHIDHGVKGIGVTDFEKQIAQYADNNYFPHTDLHVTEGLVSFEKTQKLLGPKKDRAVMVGYPKSDVLIELNVPETRASVCRELRIETGKPIVTYAPAGKYRYPFKQGASLSRGVLKVFRKLGKQYDYNVLVKLKMPPKWHPKRVANRLHSFLETY